MCILDTYVDDDVVDTLENTQLFDALDVSYWRLVFASILPAQ